MFIQYITIENFGAIGFYEADLVPGINILDSRYSEELAVALGYLLCNRKICAVQEQWLWSNTRISATICLDDLVYAVTLTPLAGRLQLLATDPTGADVTAQYRYALAHCREQDGAEVFDGRDASIAAYLRNYSDWDAWEDLSDRTERIADTETFRRYLHRYVHDFSPEPIHCKTDYQITLNGQGEFRVSLPGKSGEVSLSETEQRLFRYICFLNVADFWTNIEHIRDMHHKKKPLLIRDFIEYLDASADICSLLARTQKLHRQVIILTIPQDAEAKRKWMN